MKRLNLLNCCFIKNLCNTLTRRFVVDFHSHPVQLVFLIRIYLYRSNIENLAFQGSIPILSVTRHVFESIFKDACCNFSEKIQLFIDLISARFNWVQINYLWITFFFICIKPNESHYFFFHKLYILKRFCSTNCPCMWSVSSEAYFSKPKITTVRLGPGTVQVYVRSMVVNEFSEIARIRCTKPKFPSVYWALPGA